MEPVCINHASEMWLLQQSSSTTQVISVHEATLRLHCEVCLVMFFFKASIHNLNLAPPDQINVCRGRGGRKGKFL